MNNIEMNNQFLVILFFHFDNLKHNSKELIDYSLFHLTI
mgnify:CR=1 FL=1